MNPWVENIQLRDENKRLRLEVRKLKLIGELTSRKLIERCSGAEDEKATPDAPQVV